MSEENYEAAEEQAFAEEATQETEANETDAIRESFDSAVAEEKTEDGIKMDMVAAGATFKNVTRLYNQFMIDAGFAISKADRAAAVDTAMTGLEDLDTEEGFSAAVEALVNGVQGTSEKSAAGLVRAYCKKNELEVYKKPKAEGKGRGGFASDYYEFLASNPTMSAEEATAYVMGEGDHPETSKNTKNHKSHYLNIHALVNRIANA